MRTRADVKREVTRMLMDDSFRKPRILRFFRDYFDHDLGGYICKDDKALAATGVSGRGSNHYRAMLMPPRVRIDLSSSFLRRTKRS